jgi:hypothetical protein
MASAGLEDQLQRWIDMGVYFSGTQRMFDGLSFDPQWFTHGDNSTSVLIFGDSVDRYLIHDICRSYGNGVSEFGSQYFSYSRGSASGVCFSPIGNVGFVHVFGSPEKGPYYRGLRDFKADGYVDTFKKIKKAVEHWIERFGAPTMVLFRTEFWDLHAHLNTEERILELRSYLGPETVLATHSVPFSDPVKEPHKFAPHTIFTDAQRYLNLKNNVVMFDWQAWILKTSLEPIDYLKDGHHPKTKFSLSFGKIIVSAANRWKTLQEFGKI